MVLDPDDRDILLGPTVSKWVPANDDVIVILGGAYIAFKIVTLIITSTNWETGIIQRTKALRLKQPYKRDEIQRANILEPKETRLTAEDFTNR